MYHIVLLLLFLLRTVYTQPAAPSAAQVNSLLSGLQSFSSAFDTTMQDLTPPATTTPTSSSTSSSSSSSMTTTSTDERAAFVGNWLPIPGLCTASSVCCCGSGVASMTDGTTLSTISFSGPTTGGAGCYNMDTLAGTFTVINSELAQYNVTALNAVVNLSLNDTDVSDPYQTLTMTINSAQYLCTEPIKFHRTTEASTVTSSAATTIPPNFTTGMYTDINITYTDEWTQYGDIDTMDNTVPYILEFDILYVYNTTNYQQVALDTTPTVQLIYSINGATQQTQQMSILSTTIGTPSNTSVDGYVMTYDNTLQSVASYTSQLTLPLHQIIAYRFNYVIEAYEYITNYEIFAPVTGITPAQLFTGVFQVDTLSCTPSATCCCGVGDIGMTPQSDNGTVSTVLMTGSLDGGSGCYGLGAMSGVFDIPDSNPTLATNTTQSPLGPITLTAEMGSTLTYLPSQVSDFNQLTFTNSFRSCQTKAYRTNQTVASITTSLPSGASTVDLTQFIGAWQSTGSCVPGPECCCSTGITYINPISGSSNQVSAQTTLTGDGSATSCMHEDGEQTFVFTVVNNTYGYAAPAAFGGSVLFTVTPASNNEMLVSNTVHPQCPTTLYKLTTANTSTGNNHVIGASTMGSTAILATALLVLLKKLL